MGNDIQQRCLDALISTLPKTFRMKNWGKDEFMASPSKSYFDDSKQPIIVLQVRRGDEWQDFSKGTTSEVFGMVNYNDPVL